MKKLSFILGLACMLMMTACQKEQITPSAAIDQVEVEISKIKKVFPENVLVTSYYSVEKNEAVESTIPIRPVTGNPYIVGDCFETIPERVAAQQATANNSCVGSTYSICCEAGGIALCIDYVVRPNVECD